MIKDCCIDCRKESKEFQENQKPFQHLYCEECYDVHLWFSKFREGTTDWINVMFGRDKREDKKNGKIMYLINSK